MARRDHAAWPRRLLRPIHNSFAGSNTAWVSAFISAAVAHAPRSTRGAPRACPRALHDRAGRRARPGPSAPPLRAEPLAGLCRLRNSTSACRIGTAMYCRSEEHTSELQSHLNLVCRLLLEKKKKKKHSDRRSIKKKNQAVERR